MTYKICTQIFQTNTNNYFHCVEKSVWKHGHGWKEHGHDYILELEETDSSGCLRFVAENGEAFIIALGIHQNKRWGHILPDCKKEDTCAVVHGHYYDTAHRDHCAAREKCLKSYDCHSSHGRKYSFNYTVTEGKELKCHVVIG